MSMEKQALRERMLKARAGMDLKDFDEFSAIITEKLLKLGCVKNAGCIMAYYSHRNEPDLLGFMRRCLDEGKHVALPYISGKREMIALGYSYDTVMKSNVYGIPEPVLSGDSETEEPDVVIVPGVAFDLRLNRLGFGGGYYDRFLKSVRAKKIGVCFDFQIADGIVAADHDIPMDMIVTEKRVIGGQQCV